ncbi:hypothetical protein MKW94_014946 [Papaver nudicaule]|uniref:Uncharacterized protein n=1 Tax=Papaver nudicaule TaxID=74823 RepID=A0AA41SKS5_PAPNU|nr:hypothetical protein [Papaver nudicaule]MCL7041271.1 hypothetical protein [Papaver nudicaule]
MENQGNINRRLGPLHTTGNAIVKTAYKAYKRAESLPEPINTLAQKLGRVARPIFSTMQIHCPAILCYTDDKILYVENAVEYVFPPASYIFNKINTLVQVFETMPVRFDEAADKLPVVINRVPYLEWALAQLLLVLSFLVNTLTGWGVLDGAILNMKLTPILNMKEIRVDTNSQYEIAANARTLTGDKEMGILNSTAGGKDTSSSNIVEREEKTVNEKEIKEEDVNEEEMNEKKEATTTVVEMDMKKNEDEPNKQQQQEHSDNKEIASATEKDGKKKKEEQNPVEKFFSSMFK